MIPFRRVRLRIIVAGAIAYGLLQTLEVQSATFRSGGTVAATLPFHTIYDFTGKNDGGLPATLISDATGDVYGITTSDGSGGSGTAFELTSSGTKYSVTVLYPFKNGSPESLIEDNDRNLFGVAGGGTETCYCGQIFELSRIGSKYTETVLHRFAGVDGQGPTARLGGDASGALYGSTSGGGSKGGGTIFKLTPTPKGYQFETLWNFDLSGPFDPGPVALDGAGNIYSSVSVNDTLSSAIYKFTKKPGGGYYGSVVHTVGKYPSGYPIVDNLGDVLGTTAVTIYELKPLSSGYEESILKNNFCFPTGLFAANNILYGVTNCGEVSVFFALTPSSSGYSYAQLYSFAAAPSYPGGFTVVGNPGIAYGTISSGGKYGFGSLYALTL